MCAGQVWELPVLTLQNVTENTQKHMKNPETDTKRPTRDARRTQSNTNHQRTAAQWHKTTIKWHKMTVKKHKTTSGKSNNLRMMQTTTDLGVLLLFRSTLVTLCLCFRHSRRIKACACARRQQSSASLLSWIGLINVSSPAPWDRLRRDTRLSKYWPIKSPSIDAAQPCSRLSVAPELVLYSQLLEQQTDGFVQLLLSRRKRKVTRSWHLRETKEKIQKAQRTDFTVFYVTMVWLFFYCSISERSWKLTKCHVEAALINILLKRWMKCQRIMWKVSLAEMNP